MRLAVLDSGHDRVSALGLRLISRISRRDAIDVLRLTFYRSRFYGSPFSDLVQETLRGRSFWTAGEREVFASYTSQTNDCPFCVTVHRAFACSYVGDELVDGALSAPETSDLRPEAKAVLAFLQKMSRSPEGLTAADVQAVRAEGVDDEALDEAIHVSVLLHVMNRVMNAVGATTPDSRQQTIATRSIRRFGYRVPAPIRLLSRTR